MADPIQTKIDKKSYTKPQVTEVRLVAEEAVLGDCKKPVGGLAVCQPGNVNCYPNSAEAS